MNHRLSLLLKFIALFCVLSACIPRFYNTPKNSAVSNSSAAPAFRLNVSPDAAGKIDEPMLRLRLSEAVQRFESTFAEKGDAVEIAVGGESCLRTGYQFESKKVVFCNNTNTVAYGTSSNDVIHHEMFHALLCRSRPQWCDGGFLKSGEHVALHEAFADVFAHALAPDENFGENFYVGQAFVRKYRTSACFSLQSGEHAKGNALASALLGTQVSLERLAQFLQKGRFSLEAARDFFGLTDSCFGPNAPEAEFVPDNYPPSRLQRYRLKRDTPLRLQLKVNAEFLRRFPRTEVRWSQPSKIFRRQNERLTEGQYSVEFASDSDTGWEKLTVELWADGLLATRTLYLAVSEGAGPSDP